MDYFELITKTLVNNNYEIWSALLAAGATVASMIVGILAQVRTEPRGLDDADAPQLEKRLLEAKDFLDAQVAAARRFSLSSNALVFGQYLVGAVLLTSFVQANLSANIVGFLGALVLVASFLHQHLRPDLDAVSVRSRIVDIKHTLREAEVAREKIRIQHAGSDDQIKLAELELADRIGLALRSLEKDEARQSKVR